MLVVGGGGGILIPRTPLATGLQCDMSILIKKKKKVIFFLMSLGSVSILSINVRGDVGDPGFNFFFIFHFYEVIIRVSPGLPDHEVTVIHQHRERERIVINHIIQ